MYILGLHSLLTAISYEFVSYFFERAGISNLFVLNAAVVLLTAVISCGITEIWMDLKKRVKVILVKNNLFNNLIGFQNTWDYKRRERIAGISHCSLKTIAFNGIISFSIKIVYIIICIGVFNAFLSFVLS